MRSQWVWRPLGAKHAGTSRDHAGRFRVQRKPRSEVEIRPQIGMNSKNLFTCWATALVLIAGSFLHAAQSTGSIEGRVDNVATGEYLENARIRVDGTAL